MEKMSIILAEDSHLGVKGQRVNLELAASDVHDPTEIPSYLAGFRPWEMRADEVSPVLLVDNDSDKFRTFNENDAFEPVNVKKATTAAVPEVDPRSSLATYKVVDRFVGSFVPWHVENQKGNNYQPRMAAARRCARAVLLDRELDVLGPTGLLTTTTNWDASVRTALGAGFEWLDISAGTAGASSDPIKNLQDAVELSHQPVSRLLMNQQTAHAFIRHAKVASFMKMLIGDGPANAIASALQAGASTAGGANSDIVIPGLPPILVSAAKYKNASGVLTYVVPQGVIVLLCVPPGQPTDGEEIASTYTFRRRGPSGTGFDSREYNVEGRGPHGGTMVVVSMADQAIITGSTCGGIITGAVVA